MALTRRIWRNLRELYANYGKIVLQFIYKITKMDLTMFEPLVSLDVLIFENNKINEIDIEAFKAFGKTLKDFKFS